MFHTLSKNSYITANLAKRVVLRLKYVYWLVIFTAYHMLRNYNNSRIKKITFTVLAENSKEKL